MSQWEPREPTDLSPKSLLPAVGLSKRFGLLTQLVWAIAVVSAGMSNAERAEWIIGWWLLGAYCLYYITSRLGGRPALLPRGGAIDGESAFQARFLFDALIIAIFLGMVVRWVTVHL